MRRSAQKGTVAQGNIASYACMTVIIPILSLVLPLLVSRSDATLAVAWAACVISAALMVLLVRGFAATVISVIAITFSLSYFGNPVPVTLVLATVLCPGLYSAAIAAAKKQHVAFTVCAPLLSAALALIMTKSIAICLLSLICFPPALAMGLGTRRGLDRSRAIALFTAVAATEMLCAAVGFIVWQNRVINAQIIESAVVHLQGVIEWTLTEAIRSAGAVAVDETVLIEIRSMSASAINLLPGLVAIALLVLGYFTHKIQCSLFDRYERNALLESSNTPITVSCTAAIVFLIAHVFSYTSGPSHAPSFIAIAAGNLSLILLPALLLIGWSKVSALPKRIGLLAIAAWIGIVLAANALSASIISILALIGAFCIILSNTDSWAKEHYRKGEDQ